MYTTIVFSVEDHTAVITINRPDKLNALNHIVIEELSEALDTIAEDDNIRSVMITGAGEKAFVAGADISELVTLESWQGEDLARKGQQFVFDKIENSTKPIVAAVNGFALGGGCELALACHFIIASKNAKFGQPEVNLGLIPGYGGTQRLTQLVGRNKAMELLMTGEMIDVQEAMELGIVNKVVDADKLIEETKNVLRNLNSKSRTALAKIIECVNHFDHTQEGYDFEIAKFGECFGTKDMIEGTGAFLEKRKPKFD
jgi:enoyl-CoA hydratase